MKIYDMAKDAPLEKTILILGNFDGLHRGHRTLIERAEMIRKETGYPIVFVTYYPHPLTVLTGRSVRLLTTEAERRYLLSKTTIDSYLPFPFDETVATTEPEIFIEQSLIKRLGAKYVVVGTDYRFGRKAIGDVELLKKYEDDFTVIPVDKVTYQGKVISSSWIRQLIEEGNVFLANRLLNSPYLLSGEVVEGRQLGRTIGFPTANLLPDEGKLIPKKGVYLSRVFWSGQSYKGLTNIGTSPTVDGKEFLIETYIEDFNQIIYGQQLVVECLLFIRPEEKFESLNELKEQIGLDQELLFKEDYQHYFE